MTEPRQAPRAPQRLVPRGAAQGRRPWLHRLAVGVIIANLVDAIFTIVYTDLGLAREANPLLEPALAGSPLLFMAIKLSLVSMGVALLWRLRHRTSAVAGLVASAAAYLWLIAYHLSATPHLIGQLTSTATSLATSLAGAVAS